MSPSPLRPPRGSPRTPRSPEHGRDPPLTCVLAARLVTRGDAWHQLVAGYLAALDDLDRDDEDLPSGAGPRNAPPLRQRTDTGSVRERSPRSSRQSVTTPSRKCAGDNTRPRNCTYRWAGSGTSATIVFFPFTTEVARSRSGTRAGRRHGPSWTAASPRGDRSTAACSNCATRSEAAPPTPRSASTLRRASTPAGRCARRREGHEPRLRSARRHAGWKARSRGGTKIDLTQ